MDIRGFFQKSTTEKQIKKKQKVAPIIINDDEDFKSSTVTKKRRRQRIKYDFDSDDEIEEPKTKTSKTSSSGSSPSKKKESKRSEVSSVSSFFGSAPVKRSEIPNISQKHSSRDVIPESPVNTTVGVVSEYHEDVDFSKTLQEIDSTDPPPAKKLRKRVEQVKPVEKSKTKTIVSPDKPHIISPVKNITTKGSGVSGKSDIKGSGGATSNLPTPPKPTRSDSYREYLNREGPKAPGSKEIPVGADDCLTGLAFVFTGVGESLNREETADIVKRYGGRVTSALSRKTSYLVVGEGAGESKLSKAKQCGTKQIDEDEFLDLIRTRSEKGPVATPTNSKGRVRSGTPNRKTPPSEKGKKATSPTRKTDTGTVKSGNESTPLQKAESPWNGSQSTPSRIPSTTGDLLWVDKYRPVSTKQIIGQQGDKSNVKKLSKWLREWFSHHEGGVARRPTGKGKFGQDDGSSFKAALLSGPPGVGKTTSATLVCKEEGFSYTEMNASACRGKKTLQSEVSSSLGNLSMDAFISGGSGVKSGKYHVLIMDEVDGMAGNEDRGGVQELIQLIKKTLIPIICICNDRQHPKMRSLANYCYDLRFYKPRIEQIKGPVMSIAYKEGIKIKPQGLQEIIMSSNQDIRQVLHNLSVWTAATKSLTYDEAKSSAKSSKKEFKMGPFDVIKMVFMPKEGEREMSLAEKTGLFFQDYSIGPLFVQENYPRIKPALSISRQKHLQLLSDSSDAVANGDLVSKLVRTESAWGLLPIQAIYSSVLPGEYMRGYIGKPEFPQWLGNNSKRNKFDRLLQELQQHTRLVCSCNKTEFGLDYIPILHSRMTRPLIDQEAEGVSQVVQLLEEYDLTREDWDNILELSHYTGRADVMSLITTKVKSAFTRTYNKSTHSLPYQYQTGVKRSRSSNTSDDIFDEENEDEVISEEEEEEDVSKYQTKIKKSGTTGKKGGASKGQGRQKGGK